MILKDFNIEPDHEYRSFVRYFVYFLTGTLAIKVLFFLTFILLFYSLFFILPNLDLNFKNQFFRGFNTFIVLLTFFLLSFLIAIISVVGGIGGGIFFTPIMMAFSNIDVNILKTTGLIVAMFSGLVSTCPFMKSGLANLKLCLLLTSSFSLGGLLGSNISIAISESFGFYGEALLRVLLSLLLLGISIHYILGAKKIEFPDVESSDRFSNVFNVRLPYLDKSTNTVVDYHIRNTWKGLFLITIVGFVAGFFGLGCGWAIVPVQNIVMGIPLKVACANSVVIIGTGDCVPIWSYVRAGGLVPLFAAPWLLGQVFGGIVGAKYLSTFRVTKIRYIIIAVMLFTSFSLLVKGLVILNILSNVHWSVYLSVFSIISALIFYFYKKKESRANLSNTETETNGINFLKIPISQLVFGKFVYGITISTSFAITFFIILSLFFPEHNQINPDKMIYFVFKGVSLKFMMDGGNDIMGLIAWDFYIKIATIFACLSPAIALVFASFCFLRERAYLFSFVSIWIILLIVLSLIGLTTLH